MSIIDTIIKYWWMGYVYLAIYILLNYNKKEDENDNI